ncbi:signal transduction histidine kinase/ligand-binding sensor domain-containing protein/DNA-binding response OmpR family regulator [Bacteroides reticulotermitis]|nr:hybrid sensor histidine kinase/response regulator transcription factor [Bacteroides reticulotermitis]MBB4042373.1 signal transduction histidine kinase/ligand-binding sensor domain-containing protein/DNA-binding response OmpR family regulator [Bacteroides reticulotermitis]
MKIRFYHYLVLCIFSCMPLVGSMAQVHEQYMFKHLSTKDGLSHNQVNCIFKDSRGFMWIATAGGLNRFDGCNFKVFRHNDNNAHSLPDDFIENIQEDAEGNLWVETASGYAVYDPIKGNFNCQLATILKQKFGIDRQPALIYIDPDKNFWIYTTGVGTVQYQIKTGKLIDYPQTKRIADIRAFGSEATLLFTDGTLQRVDRNSSKVIATDTQLTTQQPLISEKYSLFIDHKGNHWVYTKSATGLWYYNHKAQTWSWLSNSTSSHPYRLSSNVILSVTEDRNKNIWIATDHGGIDIIDKETGLLTNLQNNPLDERSLANNSSNCIYCDGQGILWIGTYKKGVSYYSESIFKFGVEHLTQFKHIKNFDGDVTFLKSDSQNRLWIGTNGSGLISINRTTGEQKLYEHQPNNPASLAGNVIVSICAARDGRVWIGTYLGGMDCFDGRQFIHYRHQPDNANSLVSNDVWSIQEDKNGLLWIGTLGAGLQSFDPQTQKFTTYTTQLSSPFVSALAFGKDGTLLIGTAYGLTLYDPKTKQFESIFGNRRKTATFSNLNINQVMEDSRGLLWIATRDGLNILNLKNDQLTVLRKADGLADDIICSVIEDNDKNIWATTLNGVTNIVIGTHPRTGEYQFTYYNYDETDGLQSREFNMRSTTKTPQGEIVMGGVNGFNSFRPEEIKYNKTPPQVVFTKLFLFNEEVEVDSVYNGNRILTSSFDRTDHIELNYRQNIFSITFSGTNYILPEKNRYAYQLEGFNSKWIEVDGQTHRVTYTSLPPGTYIFRVKAANNDGYWSENSASLTIVINPPFWRSTWAYVLYAFLLATALLFAHWLVLRDEREKFKLKQIELEAQRKHELDDMKLRFFTNISHEFRTPLTLIISPLENLIKQTGEEGNRQRLVLIHRNAIRLLQLVNQLLDFRRSDVSRHKLNLTNQDLIACLRNVCQSFMELTSRRNIRLSFTTNLHEFFYSFDKDKLDKILMNLLSNAFKFTEEGGSVEVQIGELPPREGHPAEIEIRVADTGIGIADADKKLIFERFYQVEATTDNPDHSSGSGIGLHIVKEFVALHQGQVHVEDRPGGGSVFILTLPTATPTLREETESPYTEELQRREIDTALTTADRSEEDGGQRLSPPANAPLILLVDDNEDFITFMRECLRSKYQLEEARDGAEAWQMIPTLQPDIIISDVMMPQMDGYELCRAVKNDLRTSHIPLILLTAHTTEEQKIEGLETGADDYITKPFNLEILQLRISKLIERRNQKQEAFNKQIDPSPTDITITSLDEKLITRAIEYIEKNIDRSELSVEELSRELGMSRVHLYKKLTAITGKSPVEFIRVIRLKRAAQLLRESQLNISEIAYEVGFNNPKYFSKYFKEEFGVLPSDYKTEHGK